MKKTVTPQKAKDMFNNAQAISVLAELIDIEYNKNLIDHRFKDPTVNNHIKRLKEATQAIQKDASRFIQAKDVEYFKYEHCANLAVLMEYFMFMPIEGITDTLNQIEAMKQKLNHGEA